MPAYTVSFFGLGYSIDGQGTFVLADEDADVSLKNKAQHLLANFNIKKYSRILLFNNATFIDYVGQNLSDTIVYDSTQIIAILSASTGFQNLNIELSSIDNISLKRNPLVQHGDVTWPGFYQNWYPFPLIGHSDIGNFKGLCTAAGVVGWAKSKITV